jgi:hypothetical protein
MANVLLAEALRLVEMRFAVFPCRPGEKRPLTPRGLHDATTDPARIRAWWREHPNANVAIVANGLCIIDIDPGANGWPGPEKAATIKQLAPAVQKTPRDGVHLYFRRPDGVAWRCSAGKLADHVDVRTTGGYVLVSPSTINGRPYRWLRPIKRIDELPEPPEWLQAALDAIARPAPHRSIDPADDMPVLTEGQRNVGLCRLAGRLRRAGATQHELEVSLLTFNETRCVPPLSENEVLAICRSVAKYPPGPADNGGCHEWLKPIWNYREIRRRIHHGRH